MLENNRPLHILLAEDNLVNQMLVVTLLEKRGHAVVVVANGAEALAALEAECFDVVLMDVQMPEIGGFEATAAIRKSELGTGARIPIIAMTAHAMTGDRERCLEAGMDGYLSKPIRSEELFEAIDSLAASSDSSFFVSPDSTAMDQVLDRSALNSQFGDDLELVQKIIPFFLQDAAVLLARISDSIASRDSRALEHAAHTLKGSVANFHAASVVGAAQHLEDIGHGRNLSGAPQALAVLENEMRRLEPVLIELAGESVTL